MPDNPPFLQELRNAVREHTRVSVEPTDAGEVRFLIFFTTAGDAMLRIADSQGRPCTPDSRQLKGTERAVVRSVEQAVRESQLEILWGETELEAVPFASNRHLAYQLLECGNLCDEGTNPIQPDPSNTWTLTVRLAAKQDPQLLLVHGDEELADPQLLTDAFALAGGRLVRLESVGENFALLRYITKPFADDLLPQYLSVLYSMFDGVHVEKEGVDIRFDNEPVTAKTTLVIEQVSADKSLYLRVTHSAPGVSPEFLEDFFVSSLAMCTGSNEVVVRPLEMTSLEAVCDDIQHQLVRHSPSKPQSKEIYREGNTFIIPSHTAEPFLFSALPTLARNYKILGAEKLKGYKIRPALPQLKVQLGSGIDFLEADASIEVGGEAFSLVDFLRRYRKENYIVLADGDKAIIDENYVKKLERLFTKGKKNEGYKVSFFDLPEMATLLDEVPQSGAMARSRKFYEGFNDLKNTKPRLKGVNAELRPYQKDGYKWMKYLYENNMGGCLADDMGLGKTIQTIALLAHVYDGEKSPAEPSLIVMPKSLIFNWQSELQRFSPQLSVYAYYGSQREANEITQHQVVLTSYSTVRNDIEKLRGIQFHLVVLDESQNIKNVSAQLTQAVLLLQAAHRFALSGTPVENNLTELYSLFRFLNPAMFGSLSEFNAQYVTQIQKDMDDDLLQELRRKIYPFLLRRTKGEVLSDLPARVDQKVYVDMEKNHAEFYELRRRYFYEQVHQGIMQNGMNKSRFVILQALSELRRIASVPESMSDGRVASSKIPVLLESLEEAVANRHKVVVFFNFVAGIELVAEQLERDGIGYAVMTGATQDRETVVRRFQSSADCRVLLMTLKTGGVGLNLTAADMVYIFEPWWNRAEEEQAVGRLHRIGQKCTVMSFSMIAKGTIEEKICKLQDKKSQLVDSLISSDGTLSKQLTEEDIDYILQK